MPRRNRIDPFGDLHAVAARGSLTGNRGCLVDDAERVVRHHRGDLWIACVTSFKGRRVGLARPNRWTPLFFLDDAVALAAGHRPCGECRHADYVAYQRGVTVGLGRDRPVGATELNRRLRTERLHPTRTRTLDRAGDRRTWRAPASALPDGTVVVVDGTAYLLGAETLRPFSFAGWGSARAMPSGELTVLTPPTSVLALAHGYRPTLHPSASG